MKGDLRWLGIPASDDPAAPPADQPSKPTETAEPQLPDLAPQTPGATSAGTESSLSLLSLRGAWFQVNAQSNNEPDFAPGGYGVRYLSVDDATKTMQVALGFEKNYATRITGRLLITAPTGGRVEISSKREGSFYGLPAGVRAPTQTTVVLQVSLKNDELMLGDKTYRRVKPADFAAFVSGQAAPALDAAAQATPQLAGITLRGDRVLLVLDPCGTGGSASWRALGAGIRDDLRSAPDRLQCCIIGPAAQRNAEWEAARAPSHALQLGLSEAAPDTNATADNVKTALRMLRERPTQVIVASSCDAHVAMLTQALQEQIRDGDVWVVTDTSDAQKAWAKVLAPDHVIRRP